MGLSKPHQYGNEYFFYLTTGDGVLDSPYPTHQNADRLTGTATISITLNDSATATDTVPVDIPARINFFDDPSIVSGTLGTAEKKGSGYTVPLTISKNTLSGIEKMYYCINPPGVNTTKYIIGSLPP